MGRARVWVDDSLLDHNGGEGSSYFTMLVDEVEAFVMPLLAAGRVISVTRLA